MTKEFKQSKTFLGAVSIIKTLKKHNFNSFICGGAVRDIILGFEPKDIDIATSATPDQVESLFKKTIPVGKQFGIIVVLMDGEEFEVASFRNDGNYTDGRRPDSIVFSTPKEDASRRDLTINGLFFNPLTNEVIDFVDGKADIEAKKIRFIGNAEERIEEDRLRIVRAVRFTARLGFEMDDDTFKAIKKNAHRIHDVSVERIKDELDKMMAMEKPSVAFELLHKTGLLAHILPEVDALVGAEQSKKWHQEGDIWTHTMLVLDNTRKRTKDLHALWGALLHDIGKPGTALIKEDGDISNHGHDKLGAEMALNILIRLKSSNDEKSAVTAIVSDHMKPGQSMDMNKSTLRRIVALPHFDKLMAVAEADCESSIPADKDKEDGKMFGTTHLRKFASEMGEVKVLPAPIITGRHLIDLGLKPGPKFKEILRTLMDMQLEGEIQSVEDGLHIVKSMIGD